MLAKGVVAEEAADRKDDNIAEVAEIDVAIDECKGQWLTNRDLMRF